MVTEYIEYTNRLGASVRFGGGSYCGLVSVEGLGDVGADLQQQSAPYQDGTTFIDVILAPRYVSTEFIVRGENYAEVVRNRGEVAGVLSPKLGLGTLKYVSGETVRVIDAIAESVPFFPDGDARGERWQRGTLTFFAPNPYWRSENTHAEQLVTFSGGLTFPLRLPTIFGNQDSAAKSRIVINGGDAPTPMEVTFEGPATSPIRIENETTGEFIEIAQDLLVGEKLWISTAFGRKRVEKIAVDGTRTNAFHYVYIDSSGAGPSSTFFQLAPGNNLMTYSTGEEYEKAPVTIRFYPRYLAV